MSSVFVSECTFFTKAFPQQRAGVLSSIGKYLDLLIRILMVLNDIDEQTTPTVRWTSKEGRDAALVPLVHILYSR
jgi:hypothetical protein